MTSERLFWGAALAVLLGSAGLLLLDTESWTTGLLVVALFVVVSGAAHRLGTDRDREWIAGAIAVGFAVKLAGATARYLVLARLYDFQGDAAAYHRVGRIGARFWRDLQVPPTVRGGSEGTYFVERVTGLLYAPAEPTMLGGFFLFATLAFVGQVLFYLAFRRIAPDRALRWYALGILFLPSLVFWPAGIGKEALMMLFLGVAAYGAVRVLHDYAFRWTIPLVAGLAGAAAIRVHIAALFAVAIALPLVLGKKADVRFSLGRRLVLIAAAGSLVVFAAGGVADVFGIDPSGEDLDPFLREVGRRTSQGGSAVEGEGVLDGANPLVAGLRVLFRPLPGEAHNVQALASAIESVVLLGVIVWNTPRMVSNFGRLRRYPYLLMSLLFTGGFVVAFSAIFNLGILARQRTQALPFLLAALVGLSARGTGREAESEDDRPPPVSSLRR